MDTREALCDIGDKIEMNAESYRNLLEQNTEVTLMEKVEDGHIIVTIKKEPQ